MFSRDISLMEVINELPEDMHHLDVEPDQDNGTYVYGHSDPESGSGNDNSDNSSNTDSEQENQMPVPIRSNRKRGMTRLPKLHTEHTNSGGKKKLVNFDEVGRFSGKNRALFVSYLGDLVREKVGIRVFSWKDVTPEVRQKLWEEITRFFEVDETRRRFVMNRLGILLRNFRRKLYADYIKPRLTNPKKLAKIPRCYRTLIDKQDDWNNFVTYTHSDHFNDVSQRTIEARKKLKYSHRMGRGGYTTLRDKLIADNVIEKEIIPSRSIMWCKGREDKEGEIKDANVKLMADKLMEQEKQIKDGRVTLEPGMDAMTIVFGKEKGGFLKGVGTGVTATRYFHVPRNKGSSKEEIKDLKLVVRNGERELEKKDAEVKALSAKVNEQDQTMKLILAHLAATGAKFPKLPQTAGFSIDKVVESHGTCDTITAKEPTQEPFTPEIAKLTKKFVQTKSVTANRDTPSPSLKPVTPAIEKITKKVVEPSTSTTVPDIPTLSPNNPLPQPIKCTLSYPDKRNIVARGAIHLSLERQFIHGVPLQDDCYKVSIDEMVKKDSFIPHETGEFKTVEEAYKSFVPWPKYLVEPAAKVSNKKLHQDNVLQNSNKRKSTFISSDNLLKKRRNNTNKLKA